MIAGLITTLVILAVLYGFVNLVTLGDAHKFLMRNRPDALRLTPKAKLSWPSRQLVKEFSNLPKDWRPAGVDILSIVQALDIKNGRAALDDHFCGYVDGSYKWDTYSGKDRMHCNHSGHDGYYRERCPGREHIALHQEFDDLRKALAEQETKIQLSSIAGDLDALEALKQHMAESREIINDTTKELS